MSIFDALKSVVGNLDPKMLEPLVGKIGAINFAPIISNLEAKAKTDSKIAPLVNLLKTLSKEKPQNASQLLDITKGFNAKDLSQAFGKVEKLDDIPGLQMLLPLLKNFIQK